MRKSDIELPEVKKTVTKMQVLNLANMHILKNSNCSIVYIYRNKYTNDFRISINEQLSLPTKIYNEFKLNSEEQIKEFKEAV